MSEFPPLGDPGPQPPTGGPAPGWWQASDGNWYPPDQVPGTGGPAYGAPAAYGGLPGYGGPPGYGVPGYGAPAGYGYGYGGVPSPGTNGMAIASLVCSLATFIACVTFIPGVICGHIAISQIKRTGQQGKGMAIAGLAIGYTFIALTVIVVLIAVAGSSSST